MLSSTPGSPARRRSRSRRIRARAASALAILAVTVTAGAAEEVVRYRTTFSGAPSGIPNRLVTSVSRLADLEKVGAQSQVALARRATADHKRILELLESEGYYDAVVEHEIDATVAPTRVRVRIDAGPQYSIAPCEARLIGLDDPPTELASAIERFVRLDGKPAQAKRVLDSEATLLGDIEAAGFPLVRILERRFVADHATRTLAVMLDVAPGPQARFGPVEVVGLEQVSATFVRNRLPWQDGDLYDPAAVEKGRRELGTTGLFAHVSIRHADALDTSGKLPLTVTVSEAKFRTVGVGVRYDSSLGAGGGVSWEHRNIRGEGERLRIAGDVAQSGWSALLLWREPDFLRPGYMLDYQAGYKVEENNAYEVQRAQVGVALEVPLTLVLNARMGVSLEHDPVETKARDPVTNERDQDETFVLLGFPFGLRRNTTDDLLEPTRGSRAELTVTPYTEISGKDLTFVVTRISPSAYLPFHVPGLGRQSVLAGRMSLGSIAGTKRDSTPADKRFYAGGGGSIRGYDYQRVGPLDDDDEPLGGRSLLEAGLELRLRFTESFGIVGFFEGGNVYTSLYPDLDDVIRWGTGGGLRYYSPVGPFRIDVGTPVNGRDGIDDAVQVYLSLGEAF
jgi:translocation and assembly module TamA